MNLRELTVLRSVEVGGAGGEQAQLGAAVGEQLGVLACVGDVEGLDAVDPERVEALDRGQHFPWIGDVPERVRPDGDAAGVVDRLDGLGDGGRLAQAKGGLALDQVAADQRADVVDALVAAGARRWRARAARRRPGGGARSVCRRRCVRRSRLRRGSKPTSRRASRMRSVRFSRSARKSVSRSVMTGPVWSML